MPTGSVSSTSPSTMSDEICQHGETGEVQSNYWQYEPGWQIPCVCSKFHTQQPVAQSEGALQIMSHAACVAQTPPPPLRATQHPLLHGLKSLHAVRHTEFTHTS